MSETATSTKGLAPFLKELRKVVPAMEKLDTKSPTYRVGGRLQLELNYYCRWNSTAEEKQEEQRTCFPASVTIKVDGDALGKEYYGAKSSYSFTGSKVHRSRTIQVNEEKPLEESLKRISVAVNKALTACDTFLREKREIEAKEEQFKTDYAERCKQLYKDLGTPKSLRIDSDGISSRDWQRKQGQVALDIDLYPRFVHNNQDNVYVDLSINNLSPEQFQKLIPLIQEIVKENESNKKRKTDAEDSEG